MTEFLIFIMTAAIFIETKPTSKWSGIFQVFVCLTMLILPIVNGTFSFLTRDKK